MEDAVKKLILDVADKLDTHAQTIRFQALNNLDVLFGKTSVDQRVLDDFVKGPIARSCAQIRHCRARLLESVREGELPGKKEKQR